MKPINSFFTWTHDWNNSVLVEGHSQSGSPLPLLGLRVCHCIASMHIGNHCFYALTIMSLDFMLYSACWKQNNGFRATCKLMKFVTIWQYSCIIALFIIVQALATNGISMSGRDQRGNTPAHLAASHGNSYTLGSILRAGTVSMLFEYRNYLFPLQVCLRLTLFVWVYICPIH